MSHLNLLLIIALSHMSGIGIITILAFLGALPGLVIGG